jgi:hypothetical protein
VGREGASLKPNRDCGWDRRGDGGQARESEHYRRQSEFDMGQIQPKCNPRGRESNNCVVTAELTRIWTRTKVELHPHSLKREKNLILT